MNISMLPAPGLRRSKSVSPKDTTCARSENIAARSGRLTLPFETGVAIPAATPRRRRPSRRRIDAETASCPSQISLTRSASLSLFDGYDIRRISSDLDSFFLEARSHRRQPAKATAKPTQIWARLVLGFCGSSSSRNIKESVIVPDPLLLSTSAIGCR